MRLILLLLLGSPLILWAQQPQIPLGSGENAVKELFFAGLKEKMAENYTNASVSFNKVIALDPKNAAAYFELATLNYRQNKMLEAEIFCKKATGLDPNNIWYHKLQAEIYKRNGNMDGLIAVFTKLIQLNPTDEDLYFDRANANIIAGKSGEAQKLYEEIEQKFGTSPELTIAKQRLSINNGETTSVAAIDKMLAENPNDVKNHLRLSGALLEKGKTDDAIAVLKRAKTVAPDNFEIDLAMADIYQSQKQNELAFAALKSAFAHAEMPISNKIKIVGQMLPRFNQPLVAREVTNLAKIAVDAHPEEAKLLVLYGDVLYQQQQLSLAKEQYQKALKLSDQLYVAWEKLLGIQTLMAQYTEAIKTGEDAISIYPNQAILYYYRAFALHRNGQNAEAGLEIKTALQLDGDDKNLNAMIFALQAEVFIDQEKLKEADAAFDKSISLAPDNYLNLSNYAYYLALRNQNLGKAETLAAKAVQALPKNASVIDTYAIVLFKLGKYDQALSWIEKALQNNEASNPVYLEHYGDILFLKGEKEQAVVQWQKAKQAGNDSEKLNKKINEKKYLK